MLRRMWGKKRFLDPEVEEWHIECWAWLMRHFGGVAALRRTPLVLPTGAFFPRPQGESHDVAEAVFLRVKDLVGMRDWPCRLMELAPTNVQVGEFLVVQPTSGKRTAGTFQAMGARLLSHTIQNSWAAPTISSPRSRTNWRTTCCIR
jgi:hypothetical protein